MDENQTSGFIILEIADLIQRSEFLIFLIFDLTNERPNVYYELGYAHGVGNALSNILLLAKQGVNPHFDIAALRTRFYRSTKDLRRIVNTALKVIVKTSRS